MPVNVPPTATGKRRFRREVETDPHKLVNYCCGLNYHKDEPLIKLKPDSEYPDWLWSIRLGPKPNSWELEKGTKEYYLQLAKEGRDRNYLLKMKGERKRKVVGVALKEQQEYLHYIRFAALAHLEDDAGLEPTSMEKDWLSAESIKTRARDYYLPRDENKVIYMDKIEGNSRLKNYSRDDENSFVEEPKSVTKRPSLLTPALQDSRRRHRHTSN